MCMESIFVAEAAIWKQKMNKSHLIWVWGNQFFWYEYGATNFQNLKFWLYNLQNLTLFWSINFLRLQLQKIQP